MTAPELGRRLKETLETQKMARALEVHASLPSTNDLATERAKQGAPHGTTVVALTQTRGRGQRGRTWHAKKDAGLYVSFVTRPALKPADAGVLPLLAGVATHCALENTAGLFAGLKWPNDLLAQKGPHRGKKVAGILVEACAGTTALYHVVLGIGVNLGHQNFPGDIQAIATTVEDCTGETPSLPKLLGSLALELEQRLRELEAMGPAPMLAEWTARAYGLRESATLVLDDGQRIQGQFLGVTPEGALKLRTPTGEQQHLQGQLIFDSGAKKAATP